jgi:hypothetical protein
MTYDLQTVKDDLAFIKALAQEGRRAPLLSGKSLLAAGVIYGVTSLVGWGMHAGVIRVAPGWLGGIWLIATLVYLPFIWFSRRSTCSRPGASAITNVAVAAAWRALGYSILTLGIATGLASWREHSAAIWDIFPAVVLTLYGAGWVVAAKMSGLTWVRWVATGCFLNAVLIGVLANSILIYPAYASGCFLLVALPGWLILRQEPSDVV